MMNISMYIAKDGKQFDDYEACVWYEWFLDHQNIKDVHILDSDDNEYPADELRFAYDNLHKIVIDSNDGMKAFRDFVVDYGFYAFEDIDSPGVWVSIGCGYFRKIK